MLRTQRIYFFDGISKNPLKTADDLYLECVDFFAEDVGAEKRESIIHKAFTKLHEFIQKILELFRKKEAEEISQEDMNDDIPIDKENLSKTQKFLGMVKKIFTYPIEKLLKLIKGNKNILGISLAAITGFAAVGILSTKHTINTNNAKLQENSVKRSVLMKQLKDSEAILRQAERSTENAEKKLKEAEKSKFLKIGTGKQRRKIKNYKDTVENGKKHIKDEQEHRADINYALGLIEKDDNKRKNKISSAGGNLDNQDDISVFQAYHIFMTKILNVIKNVIGKLQQAAFYKVAANAVKGPKNAAFNAKNKVSGNGLRAKGNDLYLA